MIDLLRRCSIWFVSTLAIVMSMSSMAQFQEAAIIDKPVAAKMLPKALKARFMGITVNQAGVAIAVGERGVILRSQDQGKSWQQMPSPVDITLASVVFDGQQRVWAVGQAATILRSDDSGKSWQLIRYKPSDLRYYLKVTAHENIVYVTGSDGELWTSKDEGQNWEMTQLENGDAMPHLFSLAFNGGGAVLSAEHGSVFFRAQADLPWQVLPVPYNGSFFGVISLANHFLLFGMSGRAFLVTADSKNWQALETGTTQFLLDAVEVPSKNQAIMVGRGGAVVLASADGKVLKSFQRSGKQDITALAITGMQVLFATMRGGIETMSLSSFLGETDGPPASQ